MFVVVVMVFLSSGLIYSLLMSLPSLSHPTTRSLPRLSHIPPLGLSLVSLTLARDTQTSPTVLSLHLPSSLALEHPELSSVAIDLEPEGDGDSQSRAVLQEALSKGKESVVAFRTRNGGNLSRFVCNVFCIMGKKTRGGISDRNGAGDSIICRDILLLPLFF